VGLNTRELSRDLTQRAKYRGTQIKGAGAVLSITFEESGSPGA